MDTSKFNEAKDQRSTRRGSDYVHILTIRGIGNPEGEVRQNLVRVQHRPLPSGTQTGSGALPDLPFPRGPVTRPEGEKIPLSADREKSSKICISHPVGGVSELRRGAPVMSELPEAAGITPP